MAVVALVEVITMNKTETTTDIEILGHREQDIGVQVFDERDCKHIVHVGWKGQVKEHYMDDYPQKREDRTEDEQRIMTEVEHRARYEAQLEFPDENIVPVSGMPGIIERGMAATQQIDTDEFETIFREYYEAIQHPEPYLPDGVGPDAARVVTFAFTVQGETDFGEPGHVNVIYINDNGEIDATNPNTFPDGTDFVKLYFGASADFDDLDYPREFWELVQTNFVYQIRDRYLQMGETPPENYQVDGPHIYSLVGTDEEALLD